MVFLGTFRSRLSVSDPIFVPKTEQRNTFFNNYPLDSRNPSVWKGTYYPFYIDFDKFIIFFGKKFFILLDSLVLPKVTQTLSPVRKPIPPNKGRSMGVGEVPTLRSRLKTVSEFRLVYLFVNQIDLVTTPRET